MTDVIVTDNPDAKRFEAHVDGVLAGFADYIRTHELMVFTHTEVDSAFEGQGVGGALAKSALDAVREEGTHRVLPQCSFIKAWIARHPDYIPLVDG